MSAPLPDLPYRLTETRAPQVGLIILQSDESIERDFRRMLPHGLELMISRVASGLEVRPDTLEAMAGHL